MRHDVTFALYVEFDRIFNLASPASPIHYQHDPVQTTKNSVHGAINIIGLAKRVRALILQASTSEVYDDPEIHPQSEEYCGRVNPIGPCMQSNDGRVVSNFIAQALQGLGITIFGRGEQTRSFCYIDDPIEAMLLMMDSPAQLTGPVNIGNLGEFPLIELVELVPKLTGSSSKFVFKPLPQDEPKQRRPNIRQAHSKLNWSPKVCLKDAPKETIRYFRYIL